MENQIPSPSVDKASPVEQHVLLRQTSKSSSSSTAEDKEKNMEVNVEKETKTNESREPSISKDAEMLPPKKTKPQKESLLNKDLIFGALNKISLLFVGYMVSYFNWTVVLLPILVCSMVWMEKQSKGRNKKISSKAAACSSTKEQLMQKLDELPSWVLFPDRERAEWINEIVVQLWPNLSTFLTKFLKTSFEAKIRKKISSFRFEEIDFGVTPPKVDGVKVYNKSLTKDSILIDFDVFYDGDCEINFSVSGAQIGRIKEFQLSVEVRVVLKPLLKKAPVIGGIQVFFLNTPDFDFTLDGISSIPGLNYIIRSKLEEKLRRKIVFPNKIAKRFTKTIQAAELKSLEPEGVLRVHVSEARELERRDVTGKSDPYVVLTVGAQEFKTSVIKRSLNPKWDEWCEFVILDPVAQQVKFKLYDQDELNEDDFLGSGVVDIKHALDEPPEWITLEGVKHGKIYLRFTWFSLTADYSALEKVLHEVKALKVATVSSALLTVYVDSAQKVSRVKSHKKPDLILEMHTGNVHLLQTSKVKKHTTDPMWEQGFSLVVQNPENDTFYATIVDKQTHSKVDVFEYRIKDLTSEPNMEISMKEFSLKNNPNSKIILSMQLRVLTNDSYVSEAESSESYSDEDLSTSDQGKSKSHRSSTKSRQSVRSTASHEILDDAIASVESPIVPVTHNEINASPTRKSILKSVSMESHNYESVLGKMHVRIEYHHGRQKLVVEIDKIMNLPLKDPKDIPDPYVKVKLTSPMNTVRHKTKTIMDNCNPEFKEKFEYLIQPNELNVQTLVLTVKTKKKLFTNNMIGQVIINIKSLPFTPPHFDYKHSMWYDIEHETVSD